jgi:hypothetical protein
MSEVKMDDVVSVSFHILQNGTPVHKEVMITRENLIKYTGQRYKKWSEMYEAIVRDKAYISITDKSNAN